MASDLDTRECPFCFIKGKWKDDKELEHHIAMHDQRKRLKRNERSEIICPVCQKGFPLYVRRAVENANAHIEKCLGSSTKSLNRPPGKLQKRQSQSALCCLSAPAQTRIKRQHSAPPRLNGASSGRSAVSSQKKRKDCTRSTKKRKCHAGRRTQKVVSDESLPVTMPLGLRTRRKSSSKAHDDASAKNGMGTVELSTRQLANSSGPAQLSKRESTKRDTSKKDTSDGGRKGSKSSNKRQRRSSRWNNNALSPYLQHMLATQDKRDIPCFLDGDTEGPCVYVDLMTIESFPELVTHLVYEFAESGLVGLPRAITVAYTSSNDDGMRWIDTRRDWTEFCRTTKQLFAYKMRTRI